MDAGKDGSTRRSGVPDIVLPEALAYAVIDFARAQPRRGNELIPIFEESGCL